MRESFLSLFGTNRPVIGMVHVKPLPGTPMYDQGKGFQWIVDNAMKDVETLAKAGVDGIQIENQFDRPYLRENEIGPETVSFLTYIISLARRIWDKPMGTHVLLNGCMQALAIARATGCKWIRAYEIANGYISNSGYIEATGPKLMRYRHNIDADDILIFGDFCVKHGSHAITADRPLVDHAHDVQELCGDAAIITGAATGTPPDVESCKLIKGRIEIPLLLGSGVSLKNIEELWPVADGAIIGSAFKKNSDLTNPIDYELTKAFVDKAKNIDAGIK